MKKMLIPDHNLEWVNKFSFCEIHAMQDNQTCLGKIKIVYEGASKVKQSKLQTYKGQFKSLKMKEEENIAEYLLRVDEIVNAIKGLRREIRRDK